MGRETGAGRGLFAGLRRSRGTPGEGRERHPPPPNDAKGGSAMLTRREMFAFAGAGTAWVATVLSGRDAELALLAHTPSNFDVPRGACDCDGHVFPDPAGFPFTPSRAAPPSVAA